MFIRYTSRNREGFLLSTSIIMNKTRFFTFSHFWSLVTFVTRISAETLTFSFLSFSLGSRAKQFCFQQFCGSSWVVVSWKYGSSSAYIQHALVQQTRAWLNMATVGLCQKGRKKNSWIKNRSLASVSRIDCNYLKLSPSLEIITHWIKALFDLLLLQLV